jgi:hypothetical protein
MMLVDWMISATENHVLIHVVFGKTKGDTIIP